MTIKDVIKLVLNSIFYFMCAIVISILAFSLISKKSNEDTTILGYRFYSVLSQSMEPTINKGDLVIVNVSSEIKNGDIISFTGINTNEKTTHRVVGIEGKKDVLYITKGDNNSVEDPYKIEAKRVVGKVVTWISFAGKIIDLIKANILIIVLLVVITMAITIKINKKRNIN
ncbi:MAG: signal peptidase I [Clostridium sp.]